MFIKNANVNIDAQKLIKNSIDYIKDTFNLRPKNVVGIDLGTSAVKVAELVKTKGENYKLAKYASVTLPEGTIMEDEIVKEEDLINAIKRACREAKISAEVACIGLSGVNTTVKKLQMAAGNDEEIEDQIFWEAEQYINFSPEEASIGFHKLGVNEGGGIDVILAAAKNDLIHRFKDVVEKTELKVKVIDINTLAMVNVFEYVLGDALAEPEVAWLYIDIGAQKSTFMIYRNKSLVFSKEIAFGGMMITEEIQRRLAVNFVQAEDLKTQVDSNGNLPENVVEITNEMMENFFAEVKKTIDFYLKTTSDVTFSRCYLTGGSSMLSGLISNLEELLDLEVEILNPFTRFQYDDRKIEEQALGSIAYTGVVALGLAMREWKK